MEHALSMHSSDDVCVHWLTKGIVLYGRVCRFAHSLSMHNSDDVCVCALTNTSRLSIEKPHPFAEACVELFILSQQQDSYYLHVHV